MVQLVLLVGAALYAWAVIASVRSGHPGEAAAWLIAGAALIAIYFAPEASPTWLRVLLLFIFMAAAFPALWRAEKRRWKEE